MKNLFKSKKTIVIFIAAFLCVLSALVSINQFTTFKKNNDIKCFAVKKNKCNSTPTPSVNRQETTNSSVYMSDILSPYYTDNFCKLNPHEKIAGTIYTKGYNIRKNSLLDGNMTVFKLQKKYSKITGLLAIADNRDGSAVLSFLGDGVLISQFSVTPKSTPQEISLDVSNINYLTLKLDTNPFGPAVSFMNVIIK